MPQKASLWYNMLEILFYDMLPEKGLIKMIYDLTESKKCLWLVCMYSPRPTIGDVFQFFLDSNFWIPHDRLVVDSSSLGTSSDTALLINRDDIPHLLHYNPRQITYLPQNALTQQLRTILPVGDIQWAYTHRPMYNIKNNVMYGIGVPADQVETGSHVLEWDGIRLF